ncbi:hypothetical protein BV25DRAFT_1817603 [Artomyces pyxidatus]|uniref:Uncharacterized protein n=1 Tax=Artomyces pyxidatus TaxID=48021 RepID=A0ACB8TJR1_9AGAM|nr:hypothetical protein BV25DRAFT_1817603 [Artomyces pyxidatus]
MKRSHETSQGSPTTASSPDTPTDSSKRSSSKRTKSSQACTSCRKHKTRCELLDSNSYLSRCHRCEVLSISCSFETNAPPRAHPIDESPQATFRRQFAAAVLSHPSKNGDDPSSEAHSGRGNCSPWDFIRIAGIDDWTATPVLAMQTLSRAACPEQPSVYPNGTSFTFSEIITNDQRRYLLNFFEMHYEPWLGLPPHALGQEEILDLVRCTIASRHLDPLLRSRVSPALRKLTEEAIIRHVFNPTPSMSVIHAFALLALWSPFDSLPPGAAENHDSRLIASSAVNMCSSLRFDRAGPEELAFNDRRRMGEKLSPQEVEAFEAAEQKNSIWTCVHNVEAMVCLGTGRAVSSKTVEVNLKILGLYDYSTLEGARKTRLLLTSRLYDLTEQGLALQMSDDITLYDNYYDEVAEILYRFDGLHRVVLPLPVSSDHEAFYFHMLSVYYSFCRLVFLVHTLRHMRRHIPPTLSFTGNNGGGFFFAKIKRTGCGFALSCARDALLSAETLLTVVLSITDKDMLATAPDPIYSMISFAAAFVVAAKFMLLQSQGLRHLPGSSDQLMCRTIARLTQIALSTDHPAARCARVIAEFLGNWEKRLAAFDASSGAKDTADVVERQILSVTANNLTGRSGAGSNSLRVPEPTSSTQSTSDVPNNTLPNNAPFDGFEYNQALDQDSLFGLEFWQYFSEMPLPGNVPFPTS